MNESDALLINFKIINMHSSWHAVEKRKKSSDKEVDLMMTMNSSFQITLPAFYRILVVKVL